MGTNSTNNKQDFLKDINSLFLQDEQVVILLLCFLSFIMYITIYQTKIAKITFNKLIFISTIMMCLCLLYYLIQIILIKLSGVVDISDFRINQIDLIGSEYTYVK